MLCYIQSTECTDQLLVSLRQVTGAQERKDPGDELTEYTYTHTNTTTHILNEYTQIVIWFGNQFLLGLFNLITRFKKILRNNLFYMGLEGGCKLHPPLLE